MPEIQGRVKKLVVLLVKPTKYDLNGYLVQFRKGVLPCNSLSVMYTLTRAACALPCFSTLECTVRAFDETVGAGRVHVRRLMKRYRDPATVVVVGLVGVQTNQFPRACDLASAFKREGAVVVMGGFHLSGSIAMLLDGSDPKIPCPKVMPPECQALMDMGVVLFHGEAEHVWPEVLRDIVHGTPKPLYRGGRPGICDAPLPEYPPGYFDGFFASLHTMDTGRGCPFHCSFCTIINVQGHDPRYRDVRAIVARVEHLAQAEGDPYMFFVDDNFARNPYWEDILLGLIELRGKGVRFKFMVEADLASWRLKGKESGRTFVELLAEAGCTQVFMGVESVRQETLQAARKVQNRVEHYREMCEKYHAYGVALHAGYIVGFPDDTPERIREDIATLKDIGFDQASFFILTPIPGSEDHVRKYVAGEPMDHDFNNYDSFQPVMPHPKMSPVEWEESYHDAWRLFYTPEHMISALKRTSPQNYWGLLGNFVWYRWSAFCERTHPMIAGFYRLRRLRDRRPQAASISRIAHWGSEWLRHLRYGWFGLREFYVFQHVYFETRWLPKISEKTAHLADFREAVALRIHAMQAHEEEWRRRIRASRWIGRTFGRAAHRAWLDAFWSRYGRQQWKLLLHPKGWLWHLRMLPHAAAEAIYAVRFGFVLLKTTATQNW